MNPRKLESYVRGYEIKRKREDGEKWQEWTNYAIPAMTIAVRNGAYGKNKVEFPTQPFLINKSHIDINNEHELQRLREEHVLKMRTMKANWDLEHKKSTNDK